MAIIDLPTMIGNVSQSLYPLQKLITGGAYLLGALFCFTAFEKFKKIGNKTAGVSSQEKMYVPIIHLLIGAVLIYLPSAMRTMSNTAFGVGNVISYSSYSRFDIYKSMGLLIRTIGILWFIRGCVLIVHASDPGNKDGMKGVIFLLSGILAMNFDNTIAFLNYILDKMVHWSITIKSKGGY